VKLLPAIDLLDKKVVTLVGGVPGTQIVELPDALAVYDRWVQEGAEWVHVVDLGAAFGKADHRLAIEAMLEDKRARVQVGGGIRSLDQVKWFMDRGAERVIIGTKGIEDPAWLGEAANQYPDRLLLAVDARDGKIVTRGWTQNTGKDVIAVMRKMAAFPLAGFLFTSVGVEGKLQGLDYDAVVQVFHATSLPLVVAGGVTDYDDLKFLKGLGVDGAILGAALYKDRIRFAEAKNLAEGV
jgi:phosphoribosylformimino-5-aminoimidazole carboxamide ribotide isomerase